MTDTALVGLDLGTVQVKLAVLNPGQTTGQPSLTMVRQNRGRALQTALEMLGDAREVLGHSVAIRLGVTGASASLFSTVVEKQTVSVVNQLVAAVTAVNSSHKNVRTIIDLGGQFSKWILVNPGLDNGKAKIDDFALNGLCAAGSGVFLEQQAARLRLSVQELGELATHAKRGVTIAGRCSVFAKSDMIHLQQKGTPVDEIAYGLCLALARTFVATVLEKRKLQLPVALIGGGASNKGLVRALGEVFRFEDWNFIIPEDHLFTCAKGAALEARQSMVLDLQQWLDKIRSKNSSSANLKAYHGGCARLAPLGDISQKQHQSDIGKTRLSGDYEKVPVHLGIDVGSVSTNVVILSAGLEYIDGVYLATGGQPVKALDEALGVIEKRYSSKLEVLSAGATGSGRHLAGRLTGADLVKNEITAQLISAAHYIPEVETVFEIGGQDAKFMSAQNGLLQDFEMNKICSAGTGSFLEEQAERLGVAIVDEFSKLAFCSRTPVDLGSRCTVFMDAELSNVMADSNSVEDLCAGLAYAVARNYIEKVVAGRKIGATVVFQGGTSANAAVVSAFERILSRPVRVHPHGRLSGAIGAALLAARYMVDRPGQRSLFHGFDSCRGHALTSFECGKCENRCQVNRIKVGEQRVHFGDVCERYSFRGQAGERKKNMDSKRPFPELFAARNALLVDHLPEYKEQNRTRIGLVRSSLMLEYLPFWAHLLNELNFEPVVASGAMNGGKVDGPGLPPAVCLPLKLASAEIQHLFEQQQVKRVLMPSILELEPCQEGDRPHTCLYAQQLPDMVIPAYGNRLLIPQLGISNGRNLRLEAGRTLAEHLGVPLRKVSRAWQTAMQYQEDFVEARIKLGKEALASLSGNGVVVIGKPYNMHDPRANLGLARQLELIGLPALPMDLLPLADEPLDKNWYMLPWLLNRHQLRALKILTAYPHVFPIHVSNYGCGPDAFTNKHLKRYWSNLPGLYLEFDGHKGEAGLVTRLEAFADEIDTFSKKERRARNLRQPQARNNSEILPDTRCFLPFTSEHVHVYAGMLRRAGLAPYILPPPDAETIRLGEEVSSGRECHPYTVIAGDLVKLITGDTIMSGDRFFIPGTRLPCLLSQYGDGFRHVLDELGEERLQIFDQHPGEAGKMFGTLGMIDLYEGLTIIDYLITVCCHIRPYEVTKGAVDLLLADCCQQVQDCLALKTNKRACLLRCLTRLQQVELKPDRRPVVGVTGDLYTRINGTGNSGLFVKLEAMGCEVWPSPFFAASTDFELPQNAVRWRKRGQPGKALSTSAVAKILKNRAARLAATLSPELKDRCVEPPQWVLQEYALSYVNANSNHLVRSMIAKMVDFSRRGTDGVISAIGLNCMAGTAAASAIPQIRKDHGGVPIITVTCDGKEGPSQKIQLETFIHQVHDRYH